MDIPISDRKTYIPNNRTNSDSSGESRMQQDLSNFPHQQNQTGRVDSMSALTIRRAVGKVPHVCVVGAGVAGLRCADVLLQHGVKVTVLEGRQRVGGRVRLGYATHWLDSTTNLLAVVSK